MVLGPSEDGGYYLIGLRKLYRDLFDDMAWSTPQVFDETLRRANRLGLNVETLPPWYDIDTPDDLIRLRQTINVGPLLDLSHTKQFFTERSEI